jgi:hypothetical protein
MAERMPSYLLCDADRACYTLDMVLHDFRQRNWLFAPLITGAIRIGRKNVVL